MITCGLYTGLDTPSSTEEMESPVPYIPGAGLTQCIRVHVSQKPFGPDQTRLTWVLSDQICESDQTLKRT
jgi:hypothetical protein